MQKSKYYNREYDKIIQCLLCPHKCILEKEKTGICGVRKNIDGEMYSLNYGLISSMGMDPIEKKPLFHFYPGKKIFSIGSIGCNMKCKFCQNWQIARANINSDIRLEEYTSRDIIEIAKKNPDNIGVAYTYNEPTVWFEFMSDVAKKIKKLDMKNVMVTNGYINKKPLEDIVEYIDAFNIDLKGFTEEFYDDVTFSKLKPVKETLKFLKSKDKHMEITNLIIPTLNDNINDFKNMINWIASELGKDTVLHLSRYFPAYKLKIEKTSLETMYRFYEIATEKLDFVYLGNMPNRLDENNLYCKHCGELLIKRNGQFAQKRGINKNNRCTCGRKVPIIDD
ncbi:MAG: AmmeMemoRadiSam system radical SAM enzyme [Fusobacteriota bacterium]